MWFGALGLSISLSLPPIAISTSAPMAADQPNTSETSRSADGTAIVVLPLRVEGSLPPHVRQELEQRLGGRLEKMGFSVVAPPRGVIARGGDCDRACMLELGRRAHASRILQPILSTRGRDYQIDLKLIDAEDGDVLLEVRNHCDICGYMEVGAMMEGAALSLRHVPDTTHPDPSVLTVVTSPPGAVVELDGQLVGITPLRIPATFGRHHVRITKRGFVTHTGMIDAASPTTTADIALEKIPQRRPPPWVGWTTAGVGLGLIASGAALVAIDGEEVRSDCGPADRDLDGDCRWRHATLEGGATAIGVGLALAVVGTTLTIVAYKGRRDRHQPARIRSRTPARIVGPIVKF